jgi:hypothetical protein
MADTKSELDEFFPRDQGTAEAVTTNQAKRLGIVVAGSLSKGLDIKLDRNASIEKDVAVGRYVVVQSAGHKFFSLITDVALDSTNPSIEKTPPESDDDFVREVMQGTSTFGRLHVSPMLVISGESEPKPVKTVPSHFAPTFEATPQDVSRIFGDESQKGYFEIGEPLDMEGHQDLPQPQAVRGTLVGRVWQVGHRQDLPCAHVAGGDDSGECCHQSCL